MEPKLMLVEWIDSFWNNGTYELDTIKLFTPIRLLTTGFGMELEDRYVIACERGDDGRYRHVSTIPKSSIVSVKYLYPKKPAK